MELTPQEALDRLQPFLDMAEGAVLGAVAVFVRVSAIMFFLPGFSERFAPIQIRLAAALAFSIIVWPMVVPTGPTLSPTLQSFGYVALAEAIAGLLLGLSIRMLIFVLQVAGTIAAQNLSITQMFGPGVAPDPEPPIATILTMAGVALAITLGLHVKAAALIVDSYAVLPHGRFPIGSDAAAWSSERMTSAFALALSLSLPFLVVGFLYNLALGLINRAMPQLMVAFVGMPALTWIGLMILTMAAAPMLLFWHEHLDETLAAPLGVLP